MAIYRNYLRVGIAFTGIYIVGVIACALGAWNGRIPLPVQIEVRVQQVR
jgi:hypothetical protein